MFFSMAHALTMNTYACITARMYAHERLQAQNQNRFTTHSLLYTVLATTSHITKTHATVAQREWILRNSHAQQIASHITKTHATIAQR